jgi:long-chain acyl-CoA synthetase
VRTHLASLVEDFRRNGDQVAIVSREGLRTRTTSYAALAGLAGRCARELESRRIVKGDRVILWGPNGAEWVAAFFGCILRGVVVVPLDDAGPAGFAERAARDTAAKLVFGREIPGVPSIAFDQLANALPPQPLLQPVAGLAEDDTLQIVFTSGTTGEPRGVVHTHRNVLASLRPIEREMQKYLKYERIFHPLRFLHTLPLSHVFGQFMGIWIPPLLAAVVRFESRLIPADLVEIMQRDRISVLAAVPRVLEILASYFEMRFPDLNDRLARAKGRPALSRWWRFRDVHRALGLKFWALICGGATLREDIERFWTTLGFVVIQGYGMTETAALVSLVHPFHPSRGSIGKVLPGREMRLSEEGEILVRGETVAGALWEQGRMRQRESEWLATGDLGALDEAGNLSFRGRKKDVIVTAAGLNVYPEDLEAALLKQPGVRAAAVVELESPQGPQPMAALVLKQVDPRAADPGAAVAAANRELAQYQQIRHWTVWPEPDLPRTSTGKVLRREVARLLRNPAVAHRQADAGLSGMLHRITGEDPARFSDSARLSEDLHLDSLGRVELQSAIETQFGTRISDEAFEQAKTLGELRALAAEAKPAAAHRNEFVYPEWPWSKPAAWTRSAFQATVMRLLVRLLAAPTVVRPKQLDRGAASGKLRPMLLVANHIATYDVPLILYALPRPMRGKVAIAMAGEMLRDFRREPVPLRYFLATHLFNVFPLPQTGDFRASFAHAARAMDRGFHVLVFPEGRRSPDGEMHEFQRGAGILWNELRCDALPVYLAGLGDLAMRRSRWFRSGKLEIRIGKPMALNPHLDPAQATAELERAVLALKAHPPSELG